MYHHLFDNMQLRADALVHPLRGTAFFLLEHGEELLRFQLDAMERYQAMNLSRVRQMLATLGDGQLPLPAGTELTEIGQQVLDDGRRLAELGQRFGDGVRDLMREGPFVPMRPLA